MPRERRMISRSGFASKKLLRCDDSHFLLFVGLILEADDEGRGEGESDALKLKFPNRKWSESKIEDMMKHLNHLKLVEWYTNDGGQYYEVVNFLDFQQGSWHGRSAKKSRMPSPCVSTDIVHQERLPSPPTMVTPSTISGSKGSEVKGSEVKCPKSKTSDEKTIDMELAEHLFTCILRNNPTAKKPNLQKWAETIDRMIRIDKRDPDDIGYMIDWCQADEFWRSNILSAAKLREQWDQLYLKSKDDLEEASRERRRDERRRLEGIRSSGGSDRQPSDAGVRGTGEGEAGKKLPQVPGNVAEPGQW